MSLFSYTISYADARKIYILDAFLGDPHIPSIFWWPSNSGSSREQLLKKKTVLHTIPVGHVGLDQGRQERVRARVNFKLTGTWGFSFKMRRESSKCFVEVGRFVAKQDMQKKTNTKRVCGAWPETFFKPGLMCNIASTERTTNTLGSGSVNKLREPVNERS